MVWASPCIVKSIRHVQREYPVSLKHFAERLSYSKWAIPHFKRLARPIKSSLNDIDSLSIPRLQPVTPKTSLVSLKHINHILPTVYKPEVEIGMSSISQGSIFFATGNKNKIKEARFA